MYSFQRQWSSSKSLYFIPVLFIVYNPSSRLCFNDKRFFTHGTCFLSAVLNFRSRNFWNSKHLINKIVTSTVTEGHSSWQADYPTSLPDTWCHPDHQITTGARERERVKRFKMDKLRPIQGQVCNGRRQLQNSGLVTECPEGRRSTDMWSRPV